MHIIIPMAGSGQRFINEGYKVPKPFIKVRGKMIIEYVCDMFDRANDEFTFICNKSHNKNILSGIVNNYTIRAIDEHKYGPVYTVFHGAINSIKKEEPITIAYCDTPVLWDYDLFKRKVLNVDGCILSHTGFHPHSLAPTLMAYSKTDNGRVLEIKEKACYTDNHFKEHASSGLYYFRKGEYVHNYFAEALNTDLTYNGEYYITLVYNLLIRDGLTVYSLLTDYVMSLGTPADVRNFEAWQTILEGGQVTNEEDLIKCYRYWKDANNFTQR
jgi:NDP-sugar pyrophosphorylase family protein